jgi:hypothetical protein
MARTKRTKKPLRCTWTEDDDGNWVTSCGDMYILITGTPGQHGLLFCCYCGGVLDEKRYEETT